uniref:DNA mismatch repair proteins mutS family domain-containing protein n=1 Tax=Acrobeloides nanus TaxID=290746 RepID=A0A914CT37_9BILA
MYTIDSVLNGMSSFANDLNQMSSAIRKCDANSLVIIDEFGKGTMTEVGLSLLASCLNFWIDKGVEGCPHIYVSSHFHALPTLLVDTPLMSFHTMDVLKNDNDLEFQYKFIEGVIDNSFASYTARKNGIPDEIVDRADEVYELLKSGCSIAMIPHQDPAENQKREEAADRMKAIVDRFMEWDLEEDPEGFLELAKAILIDQNE